MNYLLLCLAVFGLNLLPAFAPPTWTLLVLFRLHSHLNPVAMVLLAALSSSTGRYVLASLTARFRNRLSEKTHLNLDAARAVLARERKGEIVGVLLFAISPLPSAQLFEAAGLIGVRLILITTAFFLGRLVSYSFFVAGASALRTQGFGEIITSTLKSPIGLTLEIAMLAGVYGLTKINWVERLKRFSKN